MSCNLSINIRKFRAINGCYLVIGLAFFVLLTLGTFQRAVADTYVGGSIRGKTIWSLRESPYYVRQSIWVNAGATLTIEPGVKILFYGSQGILVEGSLIARGTNDAPIIFTSASSLPAPGDWDGIIFGPQSIDAVLDNNGNYLAGSIISNAEISFGGSIQAESSSPFLSDNSIHHMSGIPLRDWPRGAIWACNSHLIIQRNNIDENNQSGVVLLGSRALVEGNIISQNKGGDGWGGGIMVGNSSCPIEPEPANSNVIRGNFIGYNQAKTMGGGIALYAGAHLIEKNCLVSNFTPEEEQDDSGGAAIGLLSGESIIQNNEITGNSGAEAIYFGSPIYKAGQLSFNNISNVDVLNELVVGSEPDTIHSIARIDARENFWNDVDLPNLSSRIFDYQDDFSRPSVITEPILTSRIDVPACALNPLAAFPPSRPSGLTPEGPSQSSGEGESLAIRSISISSKTIRSDNLIVLSAIIPTKLDISAWVVFSSLEGGKDRFTYGLRCADGRCIGLLKGNSIISRFYKSLRKKALRNKKSRGIKSNQYLKVSKKVYASAGGRIQKRVGGSIRLFAK